MKSGFWLYILLIQFAFLKSQSDSLYNFFVPELRTNLGYIIPAYPGVPKSSAAVLMNIGFTWQTRGKDKWHQYYHYPRFGADLYMNSFGNQKELGYGLGVIPFLELNSKNESKKWQFKFGMGIAYFSKHFDLSSNPNNFYVGSHFSNMTAAVISWRKPVKEKFEFIYGLSTIHFSNGHTALPNAGMNIVNLNLGLRVLKTNTKFHYTDSIKKENYFFTTKVGIGFHEFGPTSKPVGGPGYPSYHLSNWVSKQKGKIHLWELGFTYAYYTSFYDYIVDQEVYNEKQHIKASTLVLFAGHEFVFGKFSLSSQMGFYIYNPFFKKQKQIEGTWDSFGEKLESFNTNRVGILYFPLKKKNSLNNISKQLFLGAYIKANLAQADLLEYSVGYTF
ncbi:MAG: acyloxyacyl hydrolase [Bacteroidia bacterium]